MGVGMHRARKGSRSQGGIGLRVAVVEKRGKSGELEVAAGRSTASAQSRVYGKPPGLVDGRAATGTGPAGYFDGVTKRCRFRCVKSVSCNKRDVAGNWAVRHS